MSKYIVLNGESKLSNSEYDAAWEQLCKEAHESAPLVFTKYNGYTGVEYFAEPITKIDRAIRQINMYFYDKYENDHEINGRFYDKTFTGLKQLVKDEFANVTNKNLTDDEIWEISEICYKYSYHYSNPGKIDARSEPIFRKFYSEAHDGAEAKEAANDACKILEIAFGEPYKTTEDSVCYQAVFYPESTPIEIVKYIQRINARDGALYKVYEAPVDDIQEIDTDKLSNYNYKIIFTREEDKYKPEKIAELTGCDVDDLYFTYWGPNNKLTIAPHK